MTDSTLPPLPTILTDTLNGVQGGPTETQQFGFSNAFKESAADALRPAPLTRIETKIDPKTGERTHKADFTDEMLARISEALDFQRAAIAAVKAQEAVKAEEIRRMTTGPMALVNVIGTIGQQMAQSRDMPGWLQGLGRGSEIVAPPVERLRAEDALLNERIARLSDQQADTVIKYATTKEKQESTEFYRQQRLQIQREELERKKDRDKSAIVHQVKVEAKGGTFATEAEIRSRLKGSGYDDDTVADIVKTASAAATQYRAHQKLRDDLQAEATHASADYKKEQTKWIGPRTKAYQEIASAVTKNAETRGTEAQTRIAETERRIDKEIATTQEAYSRAVQAETEKLLRYQNQRNQNPLVDEEDKKELDTLIAQQKANAEAHLADIKRAGDEHLKKLEAQKTRLGALKEKVNKDTRATLAPGTPTELAPVMPEGTPYQNPKTKETGIMGKDGVFYVLKDGKYVPWR